MTEAQISLDPSGHFAISRIGGDRTLFHDIFIKSLASRDGRTSQAAGVSA
ncbi:hypothetical protein [Sulfobacillus thermotolerans]